MPIEDADPAVQHAVTGSNDSSMMISSSSKRTSLFPRSHLLPPRGNPKVEKRTLKAKIQPESSSDDNDPPSPPHRPVVSLNESLNNIADLSDETKMCFPSSAFWNRKKIASMDVASVGNASDTLVSVDDEHLSGRDLHEQAKIHLNRKEYKPALEYFEAILSAQTQRFGPIHPSVGAAMHNVGVCRQRMQQHALAANLFREAVQIRKATLGEQHVEVAASLSKLGTAQAALKEHDQAYQSIRQALQIAQSQLGTNHKTTAQMLCHLGCFYFGVGELYAAQTTFDDAYRIYQAVFPTVDNRDACMEQITDVMCNIGSIQNRRKRYKEAIETFSQALDLQLGIMGCEHARVVATLDNLAYSYSKNKDYASALKCYKKMFLAQCKTGFSEGCVETCRKQLLMHDKLKQVTEAVELAKDTLRTAQIRTKDDKILAQVKALCDETCKKNRKSTSMLATI